MAMEAGAILEHRLVMARHLGRCLESWEIVHHKNHKRNDNGIENLELTSGDKHWQVTILENKIDRLKGKVRKLKQENKQLRGG